MSAALVTGGHRRVGRAIALALGRRGYDVHLTWRRHEADAQATVRDLRALGVAATAHQTELTDPAALAALADRVWDSSGLSVLVNSASVFPPTRLQDVTEADWDACLAVNLKAPFLLSRTLGTRMRAAGHGVIINLLDWATDRPYPGYLPYFVSKAGLQGLTRALAVELAPQVRVNGVAPGAVMLPEATTEAERQAIVQATPLKREGVAEDVGAAVAYLVADAAYTTGEVLYLDGGRRLA